MLKHKLGHKSLNAHGYASLRTFECDQQGPVENPRSYESLTSINPNRCSAMLFDMLPMKSSTIQNQGLTTCPVLSPSKYLERAVSKRERESGMMNVLEEVVHCDRYGECRKNLILPLALAREAP